jgi:hypothetical protein
VRLFLKVKPALQQTGFSFFQQTKPFRSELKVIKKSRLCVAFDFMNFRLL